MVPMQKVHIIGFADLNVPKTRSKETCADICNCLAFLCDINGANNISLLELPDVPRESSKRGLADEEQSIQENCWSVRMHCDTRYIINYDMPGSGEHLSNSRPEIHLIFQLGAIATKGNLISVGICVWARHVFCVASHEFKDFRVDRP